MRIGIFGDAHDHLDHVVQAVNLFNAIGCEMVLFAGDFVSPIIVPKLRRLECGFVGCFGDNEGNRLGIEGGMRVVGDVAAPPIGVRVKDGTRILLMHILCQDQELLEGADVIVSAHTHRPTIVKDKRGRLFINPGETSGWTYRKPSVAVLETAPLSAEIIPLTPQFLSLDQIRPQTV